MDVHWGAIQLQHATIGDATCALCGGLVAPVDNDGDGLCDVCEHEVARLLSCGGATAIHQGA
ncbi:MAG: hypothetical protein WC683_07340 [bacterium]